MFVTAAASVVPEGQQIPTPETAETVRSRKSSNLVISRASPKSAYLTIMQAGITRRHFRCPLILTVQTATSANGVSGILVERKHIVLPDGGLTLLTRGYQPTWRTRSCWRLISPGVCGRVVQLRRCPAVDAGTVGASDRACDGRRTGSTRYRA